MGHQDRDVVAGVRDETVDQQAALDRRREVTSYRLQHAFGRLGMPANPTSALIAEMVSLMASSPKGPSARREFLVAVIRCPAHAAEAAGFRYARRTQF